MLKVYEVYNYVSIDGADWRRVGRIGYSATDEEIESQLVLDNLSFDEVREYLSKHALIGLYNGSTFWRNKPQVAVYYSDAFDTVWYKRFKTLSYKYEFKELKDVSLEWIMKHLSADQAIQYLKERGITACPMNF